MDELSGGKREASSLATMRTVSNTAKRHRTGGKQHLKTTHCSLVAATVMHQYGGSDTEESERGTCMDADAEAKWWSTNSHDSPTDDRTDAEWWQGIEGLIMASLLEPTAEIESADTHREVLGYALTGAADQGIWSDSEVEQRTELISD